MEEETNPNCNPTYDWTSWGYPPAHLLTYKTKNKMELVFENYQVAETTLTTLGKVGELIGADGKIAFIPGNLRDASKRIALVLKRADGTSKMVTCSQKVSDGLRDKSIELGHVLNFEIVAGEAGIPYISLPGGGLIEYSAKDLVAKDYVATAVDYAELI
jgi:hypothetical protein